MEAAAATLLVVVPAKPWRAKQRLAAPKINCRRKSLVKRRVLMLVSKHSPYQMSRILLQCTPLWGLNRPKSERPADPRHGEPAIAPGYHGLQIRVVDLDVGKARAACDVLHVRRKGLDLGHGRQRPGVRNPAGPGDTDEVNGCSRVARLPAGFALDLIIQQEPKSV